MLNSNSKMGNLMPDFTKMNDIQRQAVTHGEGPLLLLAGPGSGKTYTITNRILYLLNQGISPNEILVITFTKEAALSMKQRFIKLSKPLVFPVNFGTFHSVFYHILRESQVIKSRKLLTNAEKHKLIYPILYRYTKLNEDRTFIKEDANKLLSCISLYKNTNDISAALRVCPEQWIQYFEDICREYSDAVIKEQYLDFDDMLYECKSLLQNNPSIRKIWQSRFQHILIDEFQDINPIQYEVIQLLTKYPYSIFAVGDDDQAIYGFRGSSPDCMQRFIKDYHAKQLLLKYNYRSAPDIVKASLAVIGENKNRFLKDLEAKSVTNESNNKVQNNIFLNSFETQKEEYIYLMKKIIDCQNKNFSCAVLFRTNYIMQSFAIALQRAEIPFCMKEKKVNLYQKGIILDIMAYLRLAYGIGNREDLLRIINKPSRYIKREAIQVKDGKPDFEALIQYYDKPWIDDIHKREMKDYIYKLQIHFLSLGKMSFVSGITYILKAFGYEEYLMQQPVGIDKKEEWKQLIEWLKEDASNFKTLNEWLIFQETYDKEQENNINNNNHDKGDSHVQLMTIHASKGLEFDYVWIPDCNEMIYPFGRMPDEKTIEEERRIFYVAMTRAKYSLGILYVVGTRERPRLPSSFLNPLYSSINSSNSQLSKYSSNASATFSYSSSSAMYSNTGSSLGSSGFSL